MLATSYLPSVGINKMVYDRVYGSNKSLNTSHSSTEGEVLSDRSHDHHHGNGAKTTRHKKRRGCDQVARLRDESLMNLSTHSDSCLHAPSSSSHRRAGILLRPSSMPKDINTLSSRQNSGSGESTKSEELELETSLMVSGEYSVRYLLNQ